MTKEPPKVEYMEVEALTQIIQITGPKWTGCLAVVHRIISPGLYQAYVLVPNANGPTGLAWVNIPKDHFVPVHAKIPNLSTLSEAMVPPIPTAVLRKH